MNAEKGRFVVIGRRLIRARRAIRGQILSLVFADRVNARRNRLGAGNATAVPPRPIAAVAVRNLNNEARMVNG
jgi:hypothetical protein